MAFGGMNYLAIALAALAGFAFGAAYYMTLSRHWLAAVGLTREKIAPGGKPSLAPYVVSIVALVAMAWILAGAIGHLGPGQVTIRNGIISGMILWAGFVVTTIAVNNAYAQRKPMLTVIDGIHWLGVLVVQGAVIGAMGV